MASARSAADTRGCWVSEGAAAQQRGGEGREQQRAAVPADRERDRLATLTRTAQTWRGGVGKFAEFDIDMYVK